MDRAQVDRWLEAYVAAWRSYDREAIEALFAEDIEYRYHPYDEPLRDRAAVVASWLGEANDPRASTRDEPGTYDAEYGTAAVDGDVAVAIGHTSYRDEAVGPVTRFFDNCFVMRFAEDGRCREFTEWYVERPRV